MKRQIKTLCFLILIFTAGKLFASASTNEIDLSTAISLALAQNKKLTASLLSIKSALINLEDARLPFEFKIQPEISSSTDGDENQNKAGITISRKLLWGTNVKLSTELSHTQQDEYTNLYRGTIKTEISQPLFRNAGSTVNLDALIRSENRVKEAQRLLEMQKMDVLVSVVETYMTLLKLKQEIVSSEKAMKRMEKLLQLTSAKERMGSATRIDTLRAELQLRQTDSLLRELKELYYAKMRDFNELLGVDMTNVFNLAPVPLLEEELPDYDTAVNTALSNRLDYAQQLSELADAERGIKVSQNRLLPDIELFYSYEYSGEDPEKLHSKSYNSVWFAGLKMQTELGNSSQRIDYKRAVNEKQIASNRVEILKTSIIRQVGQQLSECRRYQEQIRLALQNLNLASRRLELARKLFEIGRGDLFSVTDAENAFLDAERKFFVEQTEIIVAHYRLRRVLGTLLEVPAVLKPQESLADTKNR